MIGPTIITAIETKYINQPFPFLKVSQYIIRDTKKENINTVSVISNFLSCIISENTKVNIFFHCSKKKFILNSNNKLKIIHMLFIFLLLYKT